MNYSQDGDILDSEVVNEKIHVESDILQDLKPNNCSYNKAQPCVNRDGTNVGDFVVWKIALTTNEMIAWSTCR